MDRGRALYFSRTILLLSVLIVIFLSFGYGVVYAFDLQPPTFQSITVSPSTASPDEVATVTVVASDNEKLYYGMVLYELPNGDSDFVILSYDEASGRLVGTLQVGPYDQSGLWKCVALLIVDEQWNETIVYEYETDLRSGNVTVIGTKPDTTAPAFSAMHVTPVSTNPGGKVHISVDASDTESGLFFASVAWVHGWDSVYADLIVNDATGRLEGDIFIPLHTSLGTYRLDTITIYDQKYNQFLWSASEGPAVVGNDLQLNGDNNAPVAGFTDVHPGDWFAEDILSLVEADALSGYSDGTFRPRKNVTRAEFAKMLCDAAAWPIKLSGAQSFTDVPVENWAFKYIETAKARGVIGGYPGGLFKPNENITRAEICKMLVAASNVALDASGTDFTDVPGDHWARQYIMTARNYEFVSGYKGNLFEPGALATRAEAARMTNNSYWYLVDHIFTGESFSKLFPNAKPGFRKEMIADLKRRLD